MFSQLARDSAATIHPDAIVVFQLAAAPYALEASNIPRVLDEIELAPLREQYVHQTGYRRLRAWLTWAKHRAYVVRTLRSFNACTVVSQREFALMRQIAPAHMPIEVVPNGADVVGGARDWGKPEPDTLIYPGALSFDANFDAMAYFLGAIWPRVRAQRPQARLRITGRATPDQIAALPPAEGIEFTGYLDDVRPAVARAWAEVVPLRKGGGTRLKILEAMALGTPVISTSKGAEGLDIQAGKHVLIADTPEDFARATATLLADPELRARIVEAAGEHVRRQYDWRIIGQKLNDLCHIVAARTPVYPQSQVSVL